MKQEKEDDYKNLSGTDKLKSSRPTSPLILQNPIKIKGLLLIYRNIRCKKRTNHFKQK